MEKQIEQYLVKTWEKETGGLCLKFPPIFFAGFPDRICLASPGVIVFVETKAPGKTPRKLQTRIHDKLKGLGFRVEVIDSKEGTDALILTI